MDIFQDLTFHRPKDNLIYGKSLEMALLFSFCPSFAAFVRSLSICSLSWPKNLLSLYSILSSYNFWMSFCPTLSSISPPLSSFLLPLLFFCPCSCHPSLCVSSPHTSASVLSSSISSCLILVSSLLLYCVPCSLTADRRHQSSRTLRLSTCTLFTSPKRQTAPLEPPVSEEGSRGSAWFEHRHDLTMTAHTNTFKTAYYIKVHQCTQVQIKTDALSIWPHECITVVRRHIVYVDTNTLGVLSAEPWQTKSTIIPDVVNTWCIIFDRSYFEF